MVRKFFIAIFLGSAMTGGTLAQDVLDNVNLYIGTANDYGQMSPGACVPYSQIQVCPDSKPRQHPGYDYEVSRISGFSCHPSVFRIQCGTGSRRPSRLSR